MSVSLEKAPAAQRCAKCAAEFYYPARLHRCPGEWEALAGPSPEAPTTSWVDECMAKQYGGAR